ncbi:MAG: hypothetical protein AAF725_11215, partial [Acidobacteriota bacterium]
MGPRRPNRAEALSPSRAASGRLLISGAARLRLEAAERWIARRRDRAPLVLAPTRGAAQDFLRAAARGGRGLLTLERTTPLALAGELAVEELAASGSVAVTGLGLEAVAARAVARTSDQLGYLAPVSASPGLPRALVETLQELRPHGVRAERLEALGGGGGDLALLARAFEALLEESSLADPPALLEIACRALEGRQERAAGSPLLLLDLSPASPLEERFLTALCHHHREPSGEAANILAVAPAGDIRGIARLERALGARAEAVEKEAGEGPLDRLRRRLFSAADAA